MPTSLAAAILRSLRPLHWAKNVLVFAPLLLAHDLGDTGAVTRCLLTFAAWCLCASGTYLINDLRDLAFDREHPTKRNRVIASGALAPSAAAVTGSVLIAGGLALAAMVSMDVLAYLVGYGVLSIAYSIVFKRIVYLDVLILSALYTVRVLAGGAAAAVDVSDWLLALSVFLFMGLALLKRYADLGVLAASDATAAAGRGYLTSDRDLLRSMGVTCSYLSVLVLALYLASPQVTRLYRHPRLLWLVCPLLLYWIGHMWVLAHRGRIHDDPIVAAVRDPVSYATGALVAVVAYLSV